MKTLLSIIVAAAFAVTSFGALAQDKKKEEVKSPSGAGVTAADKKSNVTTATGKPKKEMKGEPLPKPKNIGKRKDEKERMEKK